MCGIIGIASNKPVSGSIIEALKKLEYRGYDSAGLSTIDDSEINPSIALLFLPPPPPLTALAIPPTNLTGLLFICFYLCLRYR